METVHINASLAPTVEERPLSRGDRVLVAGLAGGFYYTLLMLASMFAFVFAGKTVALGWILPSIAAGSVHTYWLLFLLWQQLVLMASLGGLRSYRRLPQRWTLQILAATAAVLLPLTLLSGDYWLLVVPLWSVWSGYLLFACWRLERVQPECFLVGAGLYLLTGTAYLAWTWWRLSYGAILDQEVLWGWPYPDQPLVALTHYLDRGYLSVHLPIRQVSVFADLRFWVETLTVLGWGGLGMVGGLLRSALNDRPVSNWRFRNFCWLAALFGLSVVVFGLTGFYAGILVVLALAVLEAWCVNATWDRLVGRMWAGSILGFLAASLLFPANSYLRFIGLPLGICLGAAADAAVVYLRRGVPVLPLLLRRPAAPRPAVTVRGWQRLAQMRLGTLLLLTVLTAEAMTCCVSIYRRAAVHQAAERKLTESGFKVTTARFEIPCLPEVFAEPCELYLSRGTAVVFTEYKNFRGIPPFRPSVPSLPTAGDFYLSKVAELASLKYLDVRGNVTHFGLAHLAANKSLEKMRLDETNVDDCALAHLKELDRVYSLSLDHTHVTDAGLGHLSGWRNLQHLSLRGTNVDGSGLTQLQECSHLEELRLAWTVLKPEHLVHLRHFPRLQKLDLSSTAVDDQGLAHLASLSELTWLDLSNTDVTSEGLVHLASLPKLEYLALNNTAVGDQGLVHLRQLPELRKLHLQQTDVSDTGLLQVLKFPRISYLDLSGTNVSDFGLELLLKCYSLDEIVAVDTHADMFSLRFQFDHLRPDIRLQFGR